MTQAQRPPRSFTTSLIWLALAPAAAAAPQYGAPVELTVSLSEPDAVEAVDLDGDGDLDMLAASGSAGTFAWFRNLGGGTFGPLLVLDSGLEDPIDVGAADIDADGIIDIYGVTREGERARWYRGLGAGAFASASISVTLPNNPTFVQATDLDQDGDLDLLVGTSGAGLRWLPNESGQFSTSIPISPATSVVWAGLAADVDGDGLDDVVFANDGLERISWRRNQGAAVFSPPQVIESNLGTVSEIELADLTGNGVLDLVYTVPLQNRLRWMRGLGSGFFGTSEELLLNGLFDQPRNIELADLSANGANDILFRAGDSQVGWVQNFGGATFDLEAELLISQGARDLAAEDIDGDGQVDVAVASLGDQVSWFRNAGGATSFAPAQGLTTAAAGVESAVLADLDDDGDLDAVSSSRFDRKIAWYENLGSGDFGDQTVLVVEGALPGKLHAPDLDGDGDLDLIWLAREPGAIRWLEQSSPGTFAAPATLDTFPFPFNPSELELADLDLDGDLDLLVQVDIQAGVFLYQNLGGGTFAPPAPLTAAGLVNSIQVGDLTGSGLPDLLITSTSPDRVQWMRNQGQLQFAAPLLISPPPGFLTDAILSDVNSDGRLDAVWISSLGIEWSPNLGSAQFGPAQATPVTTNFGSWIRSADLDTDGDADLLIGSTGSSFGPRWMENSGGQFSALQFTSVTQGSIAPVATGDLDGDGGIDLLLPSFDLGRLDWLPGQQLDIVGAPYCGPAVANSTGLPGIALASGSDLAGSGNFTLHGHSLRPGLFAMFLVSPNQGFQAQVPGSAGALCLGAAIGRFNLPSQLRLVSQSGSVSLDVDLGALPTASGQVMVQSGETWNFQLWYRDLDPAPTSNFTQGIQVQFL